MSEQTPTMDEATFCRTLGVDPDSVKTGTLAIEMKAGQAVLTFTSVYVVPPRLIGAAFLAAGPRDEQPPQQEQPEQPDAKPGDEAQEGAA